jgi:protocatechuate 3,4-dioxygenase beta subunit
MVVRLGPIVRAKGRVLDPDGQPVKGQLVHFGRNTDWHTDYEGVAIKGPSRFDVTTDEQGRFELTAPAGLDYTVDVPSRFFPMYRESHTVTEGAEILLQLDAGEVAAGTVFLEDGRPAVGAVVRFYSFPQRHATTDASGRFEIMGTRRVDKSYITVGHKNAAVFCLQPIPEDASDLVLQLEQGQVIEGRIVDGDGQGIEGALIQVVGERVIDPPASHGVKHTWEWANETSMTRSDREGRFRFSNLYSGSFQLKAALEQLHIGAVTTTAKTGRSDVEIELSTATTRRAALRLLVLGRQAGEPIPHAGVKISPDGRGSFRNLVTDDSGHAIAVGFEPGGYNVEVDHPGFAVGQEPLKLRLGDNEARIELSPPVDVELRIRTKDGQLIHQKNRVVGIKRANGELFIFWVGNQGHAYKRILNGVVKLRGVPSEMVTLVVKLERGGIVEQPLDLRVESGSVIDVSPRRRP